MPDCCCGTDVCILLCCQGRRLPGIHLAGLTGMEISLSSHECMLSVEKVFSGTWSPHPEREGCFLQLLGNTFQCTLADTTAGINCFMVVVQRRLKIGCFVDHVDHVLWSWHKHG